MTTLAQLNASPARREWSEYTLETRFAVGRNGYQNGRRGTAGEKLHLLRTEVVVAERGEHQPGTFKLGDTFSTNGVCASNGQHTGVELKGLDTDRVTCARCLKRMEKSAAFWMGTR